MSKSIVLEENVPVSAHSWNRDRSRVAVSLNESDVQIISTSGGRGGVGPNKGRVEAAAEADGGICIIRWF